MGWFSKVSDTQSELNNSSPSPWYFSVVPFHPSWGSTHLSMYLSLLVPLPRPSHHTINWLLQLKGGAQAGFSLEPEIDRFTNSIPCVLTQISASSYQVHAPSRLHKNLPKASPHLPDLHWPAKPIRAAQSALSLVLYPACLEMMRKRFGLLQTGLIFSFRNLNALLGFLLSASLSV